MLPILYFTALGSDCTRIEFDQPVVGRENAAVEILVTDKGLTDYAAGNINQANIYLAQMTIPDIEFTVGPMDISLTEVHINNAQLPTPSLSFDKEYRIASALISGINMSLGMRFQVRQTSWPYTQDDGNGTVILQNMKIGLDLKSNVSQECPNHLTFEAGYFNVLIDSLSIHIDSNLAFILESIMNLITSQLLDIFNAQMSAVFKKLFLDIANDEMGKSPSIAFGHGKENPATDQRWIHIETTDEYLKTWTTGLICMFSNTSKTCHGGWIPDPVTPRGEFKTNDGMQYSLHNNVFTSQNLFIYQYADQLFGASAYQPTEPCTSQIFATGVLMKCSLAQDVHVVFMTQLRAFQSWADDTLELLNIGPEITWVKCQQNGAICAKEVEKEAISGLQAALTATCPSILNSNFLNYDTCHPIYLKDWVLVSCNVKQFS